MTSIPSLKPLFTSIPNLKPQNISKITSSSKLIFYEINFEVNFYHLFPKTFEKKLSFDTFFA
eukprot:UN17971